MQARWFRLPSLQILHVRCQFCVIRAAGTNLKFVSVWVSLGEKTLVQRDGQAQERAQAKLERNRRWFERKRSTFLIRSANAPYGELHTSTNSRISDHEPRTDLRRCKAVGVIGPLFECWHLFLLRPRQYWHRQNFAFGMLFKGKIKEKKTFRQGSWTVNWKLDTEKVQSTMYRPEVSRSAQTKKSTQFATSRSHPHVSSNQGIDLSPQCSKFMRRSAWLARANVPRHGLAFRVSASFKSLWSWFTFERMFGKKEFPETKWGTWKKSFEVKTFCYQRHRQFFNWRQSRRCIEFIRDDGVWMIVWLFGKRGIVHE